MIISIILAAGEGTRMKSRLPKVAHKVCGKPLVTHVVDRALGADVEKNVVVVGHNSDVVKSCLDEDVFFVEQPIAEDAPYGTAFAVKQAKDHIGDEDTVLVLCGDTPLIKSETLKEFTDFHNKREFNVSVLTSTIDNPKGYGRIIRSDKDGFVESIVEEKDATDEQRVIKEINSGIYCFNGKVLKEVLDKIENNNTQNEYYLTDALHILKAEGEKVGGFKILDAGEIQGINSKVQLAEAEKIMRKNINEKLMLEGAIIIDPENTYIDEDVKIGIDTVIKPGVILEGKTVIGEGCTIGHNSRIKNSKLGDNVEIQISNIVDSTVGDGSKVGPYANLRPNSILGKNVKIGDFVEVKNATIGDNSKSSHLTYIGDGEVGSGVNIGCGVVFVNYDGINKNKTVVKDNAFIGCNVNLIAPVTVNENSYVAAGSTITDDIEKNSLGIARARQVNKVDWVAKKGRLKK